MQSNLAIILPMALVIAANVFYHIASKGIPAAQNPFMGLIVNYFTALAASVVLFFTTPHQNFFTEFSRSNWACVLMGLSVIGLEVGFIMIYRAGGEISTASLIANVLLAVVMLGIGIYFYGESFSAKKIFGAVLCLIGIIFISSN